MKIRNTRNKIICISTVNYTATNASLVDRIITMVTPTRLQHPLIKGFANIGITAITDTGKRDRTGTKTDTPIARRAAIVSTSAVGSMHLT